MEGKKMEAARQIEPLFNEAFIRIFGREESKALTRGLVNAVLHEAGLPLIGEIERISAEHSALGGTIGCKTPRFDVHLAAQGNLVDLEAQLYPARIADRAAYYAASSLVQGTGKIRDYADLPRSVAITLLDGPELMPGEEGWVHAARMTWNDGVEVATDRIMLVVVELAKFRERYNHLDGEVLGDEMRAWAYLLTRGYSDPEEVREIVCDYPSIEQFAELYGLAINDPKVVQAFRDAQSAVLDYNAREEYFANVKREAEESGRAAGRAEGIAELANRLRELGVDDALLERALNQD